MNHDQVRRILLGLSSNPTPANRDRAIDTIMAVKDADARKDADVRDVVIPFSRQRWAILRLPQPFTAEDLAYLGAVLEAMRPGLVSPEPVPAEEEKTDAAFVDAAAPNPTEETPDG